MRIGTDGKNYINGQNYGGGTVTLTGTAAASDSVVVTLNETLGGGSTLSLSGNATAFTMEIDDAPGTLPGWVFREGTIQEREVARPTASVTKHDR